MIRIYNTNERRRHPRYTVQKGAVAFSDTSINRLGHVEDIGVGGVSFRYMYFDDESESTHTLNLYFPKYNFYLKRLAVRLISDIEEYNPSQFKTVIMKRCGMEFLRLTPEQKKEIERFISLYTTEENN